MVNWKAALTATLILVGVGVFVGVFTLCPWIVLAAVVVVAWVFLYHTFKDDDLW